MNKEEKNDNTLALFDGEKKDIGKNLESDKVKKEVIEDINKDLEAIFQSKNENIASDDNNNNISQTENKDRSDYQSS